MTDLCHQTALEHKWLRVPEQAEYAAPSSLRLDDAHELEAGIQVMLACTNPFSQTLLKKVFVDKLMNQVPDESTMALLDCVGDEKPMTKKTVQMRVTA